MKKLSIVLVIALLLGVVSVLSSCVGDNQSGEGQSTFESKTEEKESEESKNDTEETTEKQEETTKEAETTEEDLKREAEINAILAMFTTNGQPDSQPDQQPIEIPDIDFGEVEGVPATPDMFLTAEQIASVMEAIKQIEMEYTIEIGPEKGYIGIKDGILACENTTEEKVFVKLSDDLSKLGVLIIDPDGQSKSEVYLIQSVLFWDFCEQLIEAFKASSDVSSQEIQIPELTPEQISFSKEANAYIIDNSFFADIIYTITTLINSEEEEMSDAEVAAVKAYIAEYLRQFGFVFSIAFDDDSSLSCIKFSISNTDNQQESEEMMFAPMTGELSLNFDKEKLVSVDLNLNIYDEEDTTNISFSFKCKYYEGQFVGFTIDATFPITKQLNLIEGEVKGITRVYKGTCKVKMQFDTLNATSNGGVIFDMSVKLSYDSYEDIEFDPEYYGPEEIDEDLDYKTQEYTCQIKFTDDGESLQAVIKEKKDSKDVTTIVCTLTFAAPNFPVVPDEFSNIFDGEAVGILDDLLEKLFSNQGENEEEIVEAVR